LARGPGRDASALRVVTDERRRSRAPTPARSCVRTPIAVLTTRHTARAGEAVALAFRAKPRARLIGAPTAGLTTGNRTRVLRDGTGLPDGPGPDLYLAGSDVEGGRHPHADQRVEFEIGQGAPRPAGPARPRALTARPHSCQSAVAAVRSRHCRTPGPFGSQRSQKRRSSAHLASMAALRTGQGGG
jgi:cold shock CspA family protein